MQDAFLVALERWPATGLPDNPAAWIVTAARIPEAKTGTIEVRPVMDYEAQEAAGAPAEATAS